MKPDKKRIIKNFSRAAATYDMYADLQREVMCELLKLMPSPVGAPFYKEGYQFTSPEGALRVLDAGCGTGGALERIQELYPDASVTGCDIAHSMLLSVPAGTTQARLAVSDCEALAFGDQSFDIVFSNLTLQWVHSIERAFFEIKRVLKPGGIFVFSTLGPGTLKELKTSLYKAEKVKRGSLPPFMDFPSKEILIEALESAGLVYINAESRIKTRDYTGLPALLKTLKNIGASNPYVSGDPTLARGLVLRETSRIYEREFPSPDGKGIRATYEIIFVTAGKR